jgi:hypothetical protein
VLSFSLDFITNNENGICFAVPIVKLSLTYFNVLTSKQEDKRLTLTLNRPEVVSNTENVPNFVLDRQRNRILAADALIEVISIDLKSVKSYF